MTKRLHVCPMKLPSANARSTLALILLCTSVAFSQSGTPTTTQQSNMRAFLEEEVAFDRYLFPPGRFPEVRWKNPDRVEHLMGPIRLSVEFYDRAFTRVDRAGKKGRYGAVVRGTTAAGDSIVRYATLYCTDVYMDDYSPEVPVTMRPLPSFGITDSQWKAYEQNLRRFSFGSLLMFPAYDRDAAVFLAGLSEYDTAASSVLTPRVRDRLWWTQFKRGPNSATPSIQVRTSTATAPMKSATIPAGRTVFTGEDLDKIRRVGSAWAEQSGVPMVLYIAHKGEVVVHEAFGTGANGSAMTRETKTWMASITKFFTGVLVMQFVDRGLVDLDSPLDRYLPELRRDQPCPLTLRNLLTHTSGLSWAGEWASDWEPSMENRVAQALPYLTPGTTFSYHRSGYALAGKVLERISGETVPQLFQRMIFDPLGMSHSYAENTYGGLYATASDLGRFGQMLLNNGRLGDVEILSKDAFSAMLPRPLSLASGQRARSWGIGCSLLGGNGLSEKTFGHEAASGAVLRIDPANELVIVVGRDAVGPDEREYQQFVAKLLQSVTARLNTSAGSRHE